MVEYSSLQSHEKERVMELKKYLKILLNAVLSGMFIGIGGTIYLACASKIVGAFLFTIGLMMIVCYGFSLFTGAVGYLVNHKKDFFQYLLGLVVIWVGNFAGCYLVGTAIRGTRTYFKVDQAVSGICADKLNDSPSSLLILAVFCGLLMYMAVQTYRREELRRYSVSVDCSSVFPCLS